MTVSIENKLGISQRIDSYTLINLSELIKNILEDISIQVKLSDEENTQLSTSETAVLNVLKFYHEEIDLSSELANDINYEEIIQSVYKELKKIIFHHRLSSELLTLDYWHIAFVLWRIHHGGLIHFLEMIVSSITELANQTDNLEDLLDILEIINELTLAVVPEYYDDMSDSDPSRPWRVLLINYAIVATRTYDINEIEAAYKFLVSHLPEDAAQFFKEAMLQMVVQNYPQDVRDVVENFYQQYTVNQEYLKHVH